MSDLRRQDRERAFHDDVYADPEHGPLDEGGRGRFYAVTEPTSRRCRELVLQGAWGRTTLEYGCGTGEKSRDVASVAKSVTGFDVSHVAIERGREEVAAAGLADRVTLEVAEAEALPYASGAFDFVFGNSVLHHLDLKAALPELARVMSPGGTAIFLEPMGHNPLINFYRWRTPHMRTRDEQPLHRSDLQQFIDLFDHAQFEFSALLTLAAAVLPGPTSVRAARQLAKVDRVLLSPRSPLRHYSWLCLMVLRISSDSRTPIIQR